MKLQQWISVLALTVLVASRGEARQAYLETVPSTVTFYGCDDETTTGLVKGVGGFTGEFTTQMNYPPGFTATINFSLGGDYAPTTYTVSHGNPLGGGPEADVLFMQSGVEVGLLRIFVHCCYISQCSGGAVAGDATLSRNSISLSLASPSQTVTVTNNRSVPISTTAAVTSGNPWLSLAAPNGFTVPPNSSVQMIVSANPAGLLPNTYSGSIHFYLDPLNAFDVPVTFNTVPPIPLVWDAASLTFYGQPFGAVPPPQTLTVTAPTPTSFSASASSSGCAVGGWLGIAPSGNLTTNRQIVVSVTGVGYAEGSCAGGITLAAGGQTSTIPVSLVLANSPISYQLTAAPSSLQFSFLAGGAAPAAQSLAIGSASSSAGVGFSVTSSTSGTANDWLHANYRSATTPFTLTVTADPSGLAPGSYSGALTFLANTSSMTVPVALSVAAPSVTATPQSISLIYQPGEAAPTGNIQVSGGGANLGFTATAASSGWLSVSPTSGSTGAAGPTDLTVSVNPAGLATGRTYTGSVTIAGTGAATGATTITVTLQVQSPAPSITQVLNAASGIGSSVAPGEMIAIYGNGIGPTVPVGLTVGADGKVSTTAGGVEVIFLPSGAAAPILSAGATQVNAVVPYEIVSNSSVQVQVNYSGQTSNAVPLNVATAVPGIFSANGTGTGNAAALNFDFNGSASYNSADNPAAPGSYIAFFVTGEGQTSPAGVTGRITTAQTIAPFTPQPVLPLSVFLDDQPVTAAFWGEEPGVVSGVMQVNVQIPSTARSGDLPLSVSLGGASSQSAITVAVK